MYFALGYKKGPGCPIFIDGLLHENFADSLQEKSMTQPWHYATGNAALAPLPPELWLVVKDKKISFDIKSSFDGHIVSAGFLALMREFDVNEWQASKLNIVSRKGEKISEKDYFFMKQAKASKLNGAIDTAKSKIDFRKDGDIKKIWELVLTDIPKPNLFSINSIALLDVLFCSEAFSEASKRLKFNGVEFVELNKVGTLEIA